MNFLGITIELNKKIIALVALFIILLVGTVGVWINQNRQPVIIENSESEKNETKSSEQADAIKEQIEKDIKDKEIKIFVTGCVMNPGIISLQKGQLIDDAIKAVGGLTEEADYENINPVYKLTQNVVLRIKSKDETVQNVVQNSAPATIKLPEEGSGIEIKVDSGGIIPNEALKDNKTNAKIDINHASIDELDTLSGVGKSTAQDIIDYREKNGDFKTINDVMKVSGIKTNKYNKIKDQITVE